MTTATLIARVNSIPDKHNDKHVLQRAAQLRRGGVLILLAGLLLAGLIFALFPDNTPPDENSLMTQYYKHEEQNAQGLWGNGGSLMLGITRSLKRASTYSVMVMVISAIIALACFFLASRSPQRKR